MKPSKTILVTGASGLIGRSLCRALIERGHTVRTLSRGEQGDFQWDVSAGQFDDSALVDVDTVIHLAGEGVAQRWTKEAKARILNSRVQSSKLLVDAILKQAKRPTYIAASGISYYGIAREDQVDEFAQSGKGFLAEVTRQWEGAAQPLTEAGVRTVFLRTGIVLSAQGGALAKMRIPFKLGLGGRIGDGQQQMSWISLPDLVQAYVLMVENESVQGAVNAVAPQAVTNFEFTQTLGRVLKRPTIFPLPTSVVHLLFGEMGRETILSDLAVVPARLIELGFQWETSELMSALERTGI